MCDCRSLPALTRHTYLSSSATGKTLGGGTGNTQASTAHLQLPLQLRIPCSVTVIISQYLPDGAHNRPESSARAARMHVWTCKHVWRSCRCFRMARMAHILVFWPMRPSGPTV